MTSVRESIQTGWLPPCSLPELQVLQCFADDATTAETAVSLVKSVETVKSQLHSAKRKLGVATRSGAVAEALRRGLIQ